ncbi:MAG: hypothetical protein J2P37_31320 [Ktedonobacteraceae bacterium]|nr:hypothetical protein [Ktedonobacteraceae bacterium]
MQEMPYHDLFWWLEGIDIHQPLAELVEHVDVSESPQIDPEELARLEELAREYAQELEVRSMVPDLPPMDMDERLLQYEPVLQLEHDVDLDR